MLFERKRKIKDFKIPNNVIKNKNISPRAKLIYSVIYSLSDANNEYRGTNKEIADYLGISERTVSPLIKELKRYKQIDSVLIRDKEGKLKYIVKERILTPKKLSEERRQELYGK